MADVHRTHDDCPTCDWLQAEALAAMDRYNVPTGRTARPYLGRQHE